MADVHKAKKHRTAPIEVEYQGKKVVLADLCRTKGVNLSTIKGRMNRGMTLIEALETPIRPSNRKLNDPTKDIARTVINSFVKHGSKALEEAIKKEVSDPDRVLDFYKNVVLPVARLLKNDTHEEAKDIPALIHIELGED